MLLILVLGACRSGGPSGESIASPRKDASGAEVWVDAAAERGGDGTRERPLRSLGEALARQGRLTVYLAAGEYRGPFEISGEVGLEGQGDATVLGGDGVEGPVVRVAVGHEVSLRNLSVRGGGWGVEVSGGGRVRVEQVRVGGQGQGAVRVTSGRFEAAKARFETSGETVGVLLDGPTDGAGAAPAAASERATGAHERTERVPQPAESMECAGRPTEERGASLEARHCRSNLEVSEMEAPSTEERGASLEVLHGRASLAAATEVSEGEAPPTEERGASLEVLHGRASFAAATEVSEREAPPREARGASPEALHLRASLAAAAEVSERGAPLPDERGASLKKLQRYGHRAAAADASEREVAPKDARFALPVSMSRTDSPVQQAARLSDATFSPVRQEARLLDTTFTGPFRRAVRVRGIEARATLEDVRFLGAATAVGMDGGHAEIRHVVAEGGQGAAFSVVEGVMVLEDARVSGYEVSVSAMRAPRLEVHGLLSVGATRAGISVGASNGVRLDDVVVRDSGSHGALHLTGSEVEVQRLRVEGSREYGVVAVGGSLRLRNSAVVGVRSNDGITGEGLHLRQVHADVEGVLVRDTAGACVLAVQNARVTLRDAELERCGQSALAVDTRARMDATSVEAKDIQQTALAAMDGGELCVDALVARTTRQGLVVAECTGDTRVRLGRVRAEDVRGVDARCVERLTQEFAPAPR